MSFSTGFKKCKKCGKLLFGLFDGELCDECEKAEQDKCEHNCEECENNDGECCRILFERSLEQEPCDDDYQTDMNEAWKQAKREPCDDVVSRQAVLDLMRSLTRWGVRSEDGKFDNVGLLYDDVMFGIDKLPSARPKAETITDFADRCRECGAKYGKLLKQEPKTGHWIKHEHGFWSWVNKNGERDGWIPDYECSECGSRAWEHKTNYCPQCGAWMFEPQESEDKE